MFCRSGHPPRCQRYVKPTVVRGAAFRNNRAFACVVLQAKIGCNHRARLRAHYRTRKRSRLSENDDGGLELPQRVVAGDPANTPPETAGFAQRSSKV
jgi:hypothetical protein